MLIIETINKKKNIDKFEKNAKAMSATYTDETGNQQNFVMGCYGIGVSRTLAMVYEKSIVRGKNNEFNGIALPLNIAPYSIYILFQSLTIETKQIKV